MTFENKNIPKDKGTRPLPTPISPEIPQEIKVEDTVISILRDKIIIHTNKCTITHVKNDLSIITIPRG